MAKQKKQTLVREPPSRERIKKETRIGRAHLEPGMSEARLREIYRKHRITNLDSLADASDEAIDAIIQEIEQLGVSDGYQKPDPA